jgi:hypothetical protein
MITNCKNISPTSQVANYRKKLNKNIFVSPIKKGVFEKLCIRVRYWENVVRDDSNLQFLKYIDIHLFTMIT